MNRKHNASWTARITAVTIGLTLGICCAATAQATDDGAVATPVLIEGELSSVDWDSLVGKEVSVTGDLVIIDTFSLVHRGQVKVARKRLIVPTEQIDPNDADPNENSYQGGSNVKNVVGAQKLNDNGTFIIDDGSAKLNIFPPTLFPTLGNGISTVRAGSVIKGVSGKVIKAGKYLLLVPNAPLSWTPAKRPERPEVGGADITIASFNVLNLYSTIDNGNNKARGADTEAELERQQAKIVSAILALEADVIGLMEIENNLEAEQRLVAALNKALGKDAFRGCGLPNGFAEAPGGKNAIRVGMIYRADRVQPLGAVSMVENKAFYIARTPVLQTFQANSKGAGKGKRKSKAKPFTVIVNHFKSKGGASSADVGNKNKGDGQGAFNAARRAQSLAICDFIDRVKEDVPNSRVLVIGDLNAYGQEDPIDAMRARGLINLHERSGAASKSASAKKLVYSYTYSGQCGSLDHAMATDAMAADVTGIGTWHINSDEPRFLDYNEEHNPKELFRADPFRSSDHDPVLIGIKK